MIALNRDNEHAARDAAFEQTQSWRFVRVVRIIPVCCGKAMRRYSGGEGVGRVVYYKCKKCGCRANGTTTRENI